MVLRKQIPAAAGLGGGSSDAAAAIVAALCVWSRWDRAAANRIGARLGSDIPLFFGDSTNGIGLARATGRGEHVEILASRPEMYFVISHPPVGCSTAEIYKAWQTSAEVRSIDELLAALQTMPHPSDNAHVAPFVWTENSSLTHRITGYSEKAGVPNSAYTR